MAKDQVEAVKWFRKAAEQNDAAAQYNLGVCYYNGDGVAKDWVEAYGWLLLAARQGDEDAKKNITELDSKLTPEQIAEGQRRAREFKPRLGAVTIFISRTLSPQVCYRSRIAIDADSRGDVIDTK